MTCASWTFFHPEVLQFLFDWLETEKLFDAVSPTYAFLREKQLLAFKRHLVEMCGYTAKSLSDVVVEVPQKGGDLMFVPPGWAHQVATLLPCLKVAWDYFHSMEDFPIHARLARQLIGKFTPTSSASDFMQVLVVAVEIAKLHPC